MLKQLFIFISLFIASTAVADPGVGIVIDKEGNVFYTDLSQVWMIKPDGSKVVAVPNVHSHELYLDKNGQLFGEHLWYNGEQLNTWGYYLWCRKPDGTIIKVKDSTEGFPEWNSFTRDDLGYMYYIERSIPSYFWQIDSTGKKAIIGTKSLSDIGRLHFSKKGLLFFPNKSDLYMLQKGDSVQLYLKDVGEKNVTDSTGSGSHSIMSIWSDKNANLFIATGKLIKKIDKKKAVLTIYESAGDWKPASGLIAPNGDFWVMEYNSKNEVRVNKISMEERRKIARENVFSVYIMPLLLMTGAILLVYLLFRKKKEKK
ncbi:MAG: hypothetical protein QM725_03660 [Lacibacter sp.]